MATQKIFNVSVFLFRVVLMSFFLSFFSSFSYADATDDAIQRHQDESEWRRADKQLNNALDNVAKKLNESRATSSNSEGFPWISAILGIGFLIYILAWFDLAL